MGRKWSGVLARLGELTGDGRLIPPGALTSRDLPLPLMWQRTSEDGHGGSVVVARIESLSFSDGIVSATGQMLDVPEAWDVEPLLEGGVIGPSVDLDDVEYVMDEETGIVTITHGRIAGATLVSIPAFTGVHVTLEPRPAEPMGEPAEVAEDVMWAESLYASAAPAQTVVALPDASWFERPDVDSLTPLTVTDTGRVFGHIAPWGQCHVGMPGCVTAPHSPSGYRWFHLHGQRTADGSTVDVGVLTVGGGHADAKLGMLPAMAHYDNVGTAVAKVRAGEDEHGIWVAGWVLPQATKEQREVFMSSPVSGDWRANPDGQLDLVAVCSVNTPGFPVPRARVSFSHERGQRSLVASFTGAPVAGSVEDATRPDASVVKTVDGARARWAWATATEGN